jgi:mannonate dehydratase
MHLALALDPLQDADLLFAQQLGVKHILAETASVGRAPLAVMGNRVRQAGLQLVGLESLRWPLYSEAVIATAGNSRVEQEIASVSALIREAGQAGIGQIGYGWAIPARKTASLDGRGGAASPVYRWDEPDENDSPDLHSEHLWGSLERFLRQVLPEAEKAGVRLACQLTQPGAGVAQPRILDRIEDLGRLFSIAPSPNHGLDLDHGFFALGLAPDMCDIIHRLSEGGRLLSVRARTLMHHDGVYSEGFLDQDREGLLRSLECYRDTSFQGTLRPAPSPGMAEDTSWGHKGYAFSIGYLRALLQASG